MDRLDVCSGSVQCYQFRQGQFSHRDCRVTFHKLLSPQAKTLAAAKGLRRALVLLSKLLRAWAK